MAVAREIPTLPWDREPDEPAGAMIGYGCASVPLFLVVCSFAILAGGSLLILIGGMVEDRQNVELFHWLIAGAIGFALTGVWVALFKLLMWTRRGWHTSRAAVEHHGADVLFLQRSLTCWLSGQGGISFGEDSMAVAGTLSFDHIGPASLVVNLCAGTAVMALGSFDISPYLVIPVLLLIVFPLVLLLYRHIRRLEREGNAHVDFEVTPANIKSFQCSGPLVTIKFRRPPVGMLRAVRLYVAPHFRDCFFTHFDRVFPGFLPQSYHAAVESIVCAQGRDVS